MPFVDIEWIDLVNAEYVAASKLLKKVSGVNFDWDAGARSNQQIASAINGAGIKFCRSYNDYAYITCGLSHDDGSPGIDTIDFGIMLREIIPFQHSWIHVYVYEDNVEKYSGTMFYGASTTWEVIINASGKIEYRRNGVAFYTSLIAPTFPLFADASLACIGVFGIHDAIIDTGAVKIDHLPLMGVH